MNRAERKRQAKEDEKKVARGVDLNSRDIESTIALTRLAHAQFERAKRDHDIGPAVRFLYAKLGETIASAGRMQLACAKGCGHCCHGWVSASAPEVLHVAKLIRQRQDEVAAANIRAAFTATKDLSPAERLRQPTPCPLLKDGACTVYDVRPLLCRIGASKDAAACHRAFMEQSREPLPIPPPFLAARGVFGVVAVAALKQAGLPYHYYEYNAALNVALSREDAETAWLSGEDIFAGVLRDQEDIAARPHVDMVYRQAFALRREKMESKV